jgi:hypothetical protein
MPSKAADADALGLAWLGALRRVFLAALVAFAALAEFAALAGLVGVFFLAVMARFGFLSKKGQCKIKALGALAAIAPLAGGSLGGRAGDWDGLAKIPSNRAQGDSRPKYLGAARYRQQQNGPLAFVRGHLNRHALAKFGFVARPKPLFG